MIKRGTIVRLAKRLLPSSSENQPLPGERGVVVSGVNEHLLIDFEGDNRKWVPAEYMEVKPDNEEELYREFLKSREETVHG